MLPHIYGVSVYFTFWIVAAAAAILVALAMTTEAGLPRRASLATLILSAIVIIIGSKLYFLAGYYFFPSIEARLAQQQDIVTILRQGYRIPGGILLMAAALPLLGSFFRLPVLRFADAMAPSIGIATTAPDRSAPSSPGSRRSTSRPIRARSTSSSPARRCRLSIPTSIASAAA